MESMDLTPVAQQEHPKFGKVWMSVIPDELTDYYDRNEMTRMDKNFDDFDGPEEPPKNPKYDPDYMLNLSTVMMIKVMKDTLGFSGDSSEGFLIPIDEFIARASQWLRQNFNKPSAEIPTQEIPRKNEVGFAFDTELGTERIQTNKRGPRMVMGGRREGYFNDVIFKMVKLAKEGKQMGATHISVM